jgi:pantoate kinase
MLLQPRAATGRLATPGPVVVTSVAMNPGDATVASYDSVITDMQKMLDDRRGQLDTATVRIVEQSLREIDAAIRQARAALAKDPNNAYLNGHLQRSLDRKLGLLRTAATLPAS